MFRFFKRLFRTKTGKASVATVLTSGALVVSGEASVAQVATPIVMAALAALLRDGEAKKAQDDGK